ncbi:MAG: chromate efflux transporter [Phycisphaerales bacterium]|nr:chromate efflux transporter [Phycisphaerales bacterium]
MSSAPEATPPPHDGAATTAAVDRAARLRELAAVFLRLGLTAFGGPAAHTALLETEVVHRRRWLTEQEFLDLVSAANLIPGPNSTELAIHIGLRRAGFPGLLVAGACFILPAVLLASLFGWLYVTWSYIPAFQSVLAGIKPVILAVVLHAMFRLGRAVLKTPHGAVIAIAALAAGMFAVHELLILLVAALSAPLLRRWLQRGSDGPSVAAALNPLPLIGLLPAAAIPAAGAASSASVGLLPLFGFFVKVGSILYGSGYVLIAYLRSDLVERWRWMSEGQLLDAVAVGQLMPGPLFSTATFIGYLLAGAPGAAVATVGIFLPAFFFVAVSAPLVPRLRRSPLTAALLDGVNAGSVALMAVAAMYLVGGALTGVTAVLLCAAAFAALLLTKWNPVWLIAGGAIAGWLLLRGSGA